MSRYYYLAGAYHELPQGCTLPAGAVETPRLPGEGETWVDGAMVFDATTTAARFHALIDAAAEATRARFITPGAGQAMTYLRKEAEAAAYLSDAAAPVPFLTAEADATGVAVADLAATVAARAAAWAAIGPRIEAARLAAKQAVSAAANAQAMQQATMVDWVAVVEGN